MRGVRESSKDKAVATLPAAGSIAFRRGGLLLAVTHAYLLRFQERRLPGSLFGVRPNGTEKRRTTPSLQEPQYQDIVSKGNCSASTTQGEQKATGKVIAIAKLIVEQRNPHSRHNRRGIALLLTLGILVLLTLLALGFSSSQLTESQAARNFYYIAKAEEIALAGLETGIAVLKEDARTTSSDHLFERWALFYKGDDGVAGDDDEDADLSDYDELQHNVDESGVFRVGSARKDPWKDALPDSRWIVATALDPGSGEERAVGRYAICIEDESAKVNLNTAGNPDPQSFSWKQRQHMGFTTAEIDLGTIFENLGELFADVVDGMTSYPKNVSSRTAYDVVRWRYGDNVNRIPGSEITPGEEKDDNNTSLMPPPLRQDSNGIDDNGDGRIDEPGEEIDEPGEFDPYAPMEMLPPGRLSANVTAQPGTTGLRGDDTSYLTTSHVKMAVPLNNPDKLDKLYRVLLPYITVHSQDLNRFSSRDFGEMAGDIEWMTRWNIGGWISPSDVRRFMDGIDFPYSGNRVREDVLRQIAVNILDFIDRDWEPTRYDELMGIEPYVYLNEMYPNPPEVPQADNTTVEDWGEWIELWNPYDFDMDVSHYRITIDDSGQPMRIGSMGGKTTVEARSLFIIADTRGTVVNPRTGIEEEKYNLAPRAYPGVRVDAYAPLKLDAPFHDLVLEVWIGGKPYPMETHYPDPFSRPDQTLQKNDPRVLEDWKPGPPTPAALNVNVPPDAHSHFYHPGLNARRRDLSFDVNSAIDLAHAGALSSIGELGMVHRGEHWQSLDFTGQFGYPEDTRLLDVLTLPYPYRYSGPTIPGDPFPPRQFVPGRININTAPPEILLGLNWDNMFDELSSYGIRVGSGLRFAMIDYILKTRPYQNLADVARKISHFPVLLNAPEAAQEAFLRYNANLITTKSNVFKITVLAQAFGRRGEVVSTRKLEAIVDRGFAPGSLGRPAEPNPTATDIRRTEAPHILHFRWLTED